MAQRCRQGTDVMYGGRRGRNSDSRILEGTVEEERAEIMKTIEILHLNYNRRVCVNGCSMEAGRQVPHHPVVLFHRPFQTLIPRPMSE